MSAQTQTKIRDLNIEMMITNAQQASEFLKALSHEARLVILCLLVEGEKSVTEIEQTLSLRQPSPGGGASGCSTAPAFKLKSGRRDSRKGSMSLSTI